MTAKMEWRAYFHPDEAPGTSRSRRGSSEAVRHIEGLEYACETPPGNALLVLRKPLNEAVKERFTENRWTLAAAESITGGKLSDYLIRVPGASRYFAGAAITYQLPAKSRVLGISADYLQRMGAVNKVVACKMAEGARRLFGTDWAVAVTGVAGPDAGSHGEPIGTIWTAVASKHRTRAVLSLMGDAARKMGRERIRMSATHLALIQLWQESGASDEGILRA